MINSFDFLVGVLILDNVYLYFLSNALAVALNSLLVTFGIVVNSSTATKFTKSLVFSLLPLSYTYFVDDMSG